MIIDSNQKVNNAQQQLNSRVNDSEVVLCVQGVSKKFCRDLKRSLFYGVKDIASDLAGLRTKSDKLRTKEFWALDNVSFQLKKGEALGLVGKNGSGKSTLLRIIAGLIKPDLGTVEVKGRVAPLIALGAGFNPILTGRENIYANMAILGLSKQEIDERFDDVVEFAEIGEAIEAPVQSYSSGMAARLGFASAIHTEPEILLIDEVLAVGDIRFRAKCHRRLHELREQGTSFILVSHQPQAILNVCKLAAYLSKGQLKASGDTNTIMSLYEEDLFFKGVDQALGRMNLPEKRKSQSSGLDIISLFFKDNQDNIIDLPLTGFSTNFCVEFKAYQEIKNIGINIRIKSISGEGDDILVLSSFNDKNLFNIVPGNHEIQVRMTNLGLKPGLYTMKILLRKEGLYMLDCVESFRFTVKAKEPIGSSLFYQERSWKLISK